MEFYKRSTMFTSCSLSLSVFLQSHCKIQLMILYQRLGHAVSSIIVSLKM